MINDGKYQLFTPFTYACYMDRGDIVDYFLSTDIDINFSTEIIDSAIFKSLRSIDILREV